ncbi:glycosyltransferase family 4 protein [Chryseobacterium sp. MDT2-18]|uniref:glycosyltransferase family 4 protein n=1 Tax=Chryseobacterium sp. MDT2-18 TaxID=1259136 RepID=UPI0027891756|nr:glycosyltransferase family 4 protein [Chryseobacterium sp. MDT2-18]MDQ0476451.1 glycosyltransferase involved in cell wall biosynthesis [Chryseobacterium sp. MDT2-18]
MKIALVENFGSDFYGARMRYALFLQEKGHEVIAIVPNDGFAKRIQEEGIKTIALNVDIRKRNLSSMKIFAGELRKIFKREQFDIIHLYRMQPNLIGTPIAYFSSKDAKIINHITGLGVAFTKNTPKYNLIKFCIKLLYKVNSNFFKASLIFQNDEDKKELGNDKKFFVVKGSAVNEDRFVPHLEINDNLKTELRETVGIKDGITFIFVSRLLKQKGLSYLIQAINSINKSNETVKINLIIAGWLDPNNPDSFSQTEIDIFSKLERIFFLGKRTDINELIAFADIAVLPTFYREGTPRFLLEAMASAKPIITTDMPGCNHLVKNTKNGILVKPESTDELIKAIKILTGKNLKNAGSESLKIYEEEFSETVVYNHLLNIYKIH